MLSHLQTHLFRQVKHLSLRHLLRWHAFQLHATRLTTLYPMDNNMIRLVHRLQPSAFMPHLTTRLLPAAMAQTMRRAFLIPVAAGRFAAVMTVFVLLIFQRLQLRFQCSNRSRQLIKYFQDRFFPLQIRGSHGFTIG
jgi:hypothetical protein